MPTQVELPDGRLAEFPDTMSREDIKSVLQRKFPKPGPTFGEVINRPIEQVGSPTYAGPVDLARNQPPAVPGINWEEWNRLNQIPLTEERYTGVPSSAGITPEIIPSGRRLTEMVTGIPQQYAESFRQEVPALRALDIPMTLAASAGKTAIGLGEYLSSPQGVTELVLSQTPAKLLVLAKWAKDMAGGAYKEGAALGKLLVKPNKTQQDWQAISDHTVNAVAMALGTFGVTRQGVGEIRTLAKKLEMPEGKIQLEDRGPQIQAMEDAIKLQRPEGLGPFTRAQAPGEGPISMGVRTQPPLSPSAELGTPLFPAIGMKGQEVPLAPPIELQATFDPSGLKTWPIEIPEKIAFPLQLDRSGNFIDRFGRSVSFAQGIELGEKSVQPPQPAIAPGARPVAATAKVRLMGEAAQRMADFEKALAEKVSQEQEARTHPDKPLTDNQLRIIQDSLTRALSDNQLKGKGGLVADGPLEAWADQVLGEVGPTPLHGGVPVKLAAAAAVKGAALLERGVRDAAKWAEEMVKQFGEGIRPMLSQIRNQSDEIFAKKGGEPNALQREAETAVRNVQQPEVTQEGAGRVPADEGRPQAPEARQEITQPKGGVERGLQEGQKAEVNQSPRGLSDADLKRNYAEYIARILDYGARGEQVPESVQRIAGDLVDEINRRGIEITTPDQGKTQRAPSAPVTEAPGNLWYHDATRSTQDVLTSGELKGGTQSQASFGEPFTKPPRKAGDVDILFTSTQSAGFGHINETTGLRVSWIAPSKLSDPHIDILARDSSGKTISVKDAYLSGVRDVSDLKEIGKKRIDESSQSPGSIISKLESLKFPETGEGQLYSLPHPDVIIKIGKQAWNDALDAAIAAVKAGRVVGDAIEEAIKLIRDRNPKLDESKLRTNLGFIFRTEEQALGVKPETTTVRYPVEGESVEMRKSAERATTSEMIPEPVQRRIESAPESFYNQQVGDQVRDLVNAMKDSDLAAVPRDSNIYVAARLTQALRLFRAGKYDAGYNIFVELEKEGTRMGQLINQFKMLRGSRPEDVVQIINNKLKKSGRDVLNSSQQKMAVELFAKNQLADRNLEIATDAWKLDPSDAKAAEAEAALTDANKAAIALQRFASKYEPKGFFDLLKSIMQGTLLTPISEVANLVGNLGFLQGRQGTRTVATGFDILDSYLRGRKRSITVQPIRGTIEAFKGAGRGALEIPEIFKRGTGDVIKGETRSGLHPMQAWINLFSKNPEMPTVGGRIKLQDRLNLLLEGTFGIPAEMMLRGLGAGDIIFKEAARARATATELKLANVPKSKWAFAQKFPELFLDDAALERIHQETLSAVFQRSSKSLNFLTRFIRGRGSFLDFAAATVAPYKLTPWNIVGESLSYNPVVAFSRALYDFKRGETRSGKINAGKFLVGSMIATAGWWLYRNGLLAPSMDQKDEAQKARLAAREILPPNHINLSGLNRAFDKFAKGEKPTFADTDFRPGDKTIDIFRAGGLAGSIFYMTANIGRDFEKKPEVPNSEIWLAILRQSTLEQARFGMNQSFLSGVEGFLSAIREGNTDDYARQWLNTLISIPLANSLTTMSRTMREYKPELRADTFPKQVENIVRNRLGIANLDEYLPLKRGLWGEPLPETPKDRNAIIYHFFDVFKGQQVTDDPVSIMIYKLYRETSNTKVIPSIVSKNLIVKSKNYPLSPERQSRLAELVGTERRRIVDKVVINPKFHQLSNEGKIELLDKIYDAGLKIGKKNFLKELAAKGEVLEPKPAKAGFRPVEAE